MCGRFTLRAAPQVLAEEFNVPEATLFEPRYNVAPSQCVPVVRVEDGQRRLALLRWGLIPHWATDPKIAYQLINARSETAATKPAFRDAFRQRRCLIAADGFYEWKKNGKAKQPYYIHRADGRPFGFAGLWERWQPPTGEPIETCTVLTTAANGLLAPLHDRMPVILNRADYAVWLDPKVTPARLQELMRPLPQELLAATPVSSRVNSPKNEDASCIEPLAESPSVPLQNADKKDPLTSNSLFPAEGP